MSLFVYPAQPITASGSGLATEVKQDTQITLATTLNAKDFATETTLATRATEATLATRASEATLATRATEATLATRATEATLATRASETTVAAIDTKVATSNTNTGSIDTKLTTTNSSLSSIDSKVLTDTQLRATAVPVSGPLTDTQLRAAAVPVSAAALPLPSGAATSANQTTEIGHLSTLSSAVTLAKVQVDVITSALPSGASTSALQTTGNSSLSSIDGKVLTDTQLRASAVPVSVASLPLPSGSATSALQTTGNSSLSSIDGKIPASLTVTATRLLVDGSGVTQPVSGTFFQATQPVSGTFFQATQPVSGTFFQTTQPVSAASLPLPTGAATETTVATLLTDTQLRASAVPVSVASLPLPSGGATSALQTTGNSSLSSIDGKVPANLTVTSTRLLVDGSGVTQPVSGTFFQATQPVSVAGSVAVTGPLTDTQLRAAAVPVSGTFFQATQPVSGTVAATQSGTWNITNVSGTISLPTGAATESTLSTVQTNTATILTNTNRLGPVDQLDTPLLDTSSSNITASAGSPLQVVASTAAAVRRIQSVEDIGEFIGLYTGAAASEVLHVVLPLGGGEIEVNIPISTRISLRNMKNAAITTGFMAINFLG